MEVIGGTIVPFHPAAMDELAAHMSPDEFVKVAGRAVALAVGVPADVQAWAMSAQGLVKVAWMVARTQTGVKVAVLEGDALVSVDGATPVAGPVDVTGPADHPWQVSLVRDGQVIGVSVLPAGQDSADGAVYAP